MSTIELNAILNSETTEAILNLGARNVSFDKTFYIKFNKAGGDTPYVELYAEPIDGFGYVPFSKSPLDLDVVSFDNDCGGIGINDLARLGKLKFVLVGAVNEDTTAHIIVTS